MKLLQLVFVALMLVGLVTGNIAGVLLAGAFILLIRWAERQFEERIKEFNKTRKTD